jgi:Ion channel
LLAGVITCFAVVHLIETLIWAVPIHRLGMIPDLRDAYYYVLESYTTLGEGAVSLPDRWRLIGPIIAMSGLFTFGWTGSVLVGIMTEYSQLDRSTARRKQKAEEAEGERETRS